MNYGAIQMTAIDPQAQKVMLSAFLRRDLYRATMDMKLCDLPAGMVKPTPDVTILAYYREEALAVLNKLAKRADRYEQEITWAMHEYTREVTFTRWDGERVKKIEGYIDFFIDGTAPQIAGFRFLAQLDRTPGGVLVAAVPGAEIGAFGREWDGRCDHCGSKRSRRIGYVVESADGRKIVGKSCLRDYVGCDFPTNLLSAFNQYRQIADMGDEEEGFGGGRWYKSTLGVIALARAAVALFGYTKAVEGGASTKSLVMEAQSKSEKKSTEARAILRDLVERGQHYEDDAKRVMAWAQSLDPKDDYEHNLKVLLSGYDFPAARLGTVVSAAVAYDRVMAAEARRKARIENAVPSHHVGEIKKRMTLDIVVEAVIGLPDRGFGPSVIYLMRADDGAMLKWKTSAFTDTDIDGKPTEVGARLRATFTPKAHTVYQDQPQTEITRCKLEKVA